MSTITLGVDLAKRVISVCAVDSAGHVLRRQELKPMHPGIASRRAARG